ncbi:GNAT family N-acetyltransferase [Bacillus zhangzhouensis]|uniref:GNAT family N-acetyltransferase n=1 Tax=Bacillus zhangzhouensis TaxID=1178540 RepID=UPI003D9A6664
MILEALRLNPEGFAMIYAEENVDTKGNYSSRCASAQSIGHLEPFIKINWWLGHAHTRNLAAMKAPRKCDSHACNGCWPRTRNRQGPDDESSVLRTRKKGLIVVTTNLLYRSVGFESYAVEEKALNMNDTYVDEEKMVLFLSSFGGDKSETTGHVHHISSRTK